MLMMKRLLLAVAVLALGITGVASASTVRRSSNHHRYVCQRLYTVKMDQRAARAIYRGTRQATKRNARTLGRLERCQRNRAAQRYVRWYNRNQAAQNASRRYWGNPENWPVAKASWFNDSTTACGVDASTYQWGTASEQYPCGTRVDLERNGVRITVTVIDYGPDPSTGRMWDLTPHAMQTLDGMGAGVIDVHYRVH